MTFNKMALVLQNGRMLEGGHNLINYKGVPIAGGYINLVTIETVFHKTQIFVSPNCYSVSPNSGSACFTDLEAKFFL